MATTVSKTTTTKTPAKTTTTKVTAPAKTTAKVDVSSALADSNAYAKANGLPTQTLAQAQVKQQQAVKDYATNYGSSSGSSSSKTKTTAYNPTNVPVNKANVGDLTTGGDLVGPLKTNPYDSAGADTDYINSIPESTGQGTPVVAKTAVDVAKEKANSQLNLTNKIAQQFDLQGDYAKLQKKAGVRDITDQLGEARTQLAQLRNEANARQQSIRQENAPLGIVIGQQNEAERSDSLAIGAQAAVVEALNGNLELANQYVDRALDLRYKDLNAKYDNAKYNLGILREDASSEEKKVLDQKNRDWDEYKIEKTQFLDDKSYAMKEAIKGIQDGTIASSSLSSIANATTQAELTKALGGFRAKALANGGALSASATQDLGAYAANYADTNKLPSPAELKLSGLTIGQVTGAAKEIPRPNGALVSRNTGVKPDLTAQQEDGIIALRDADAKLAQLKDLYNNPYTSIPFTSERQQYKTIRDEFVDLLARSRTGAAISADEERNYASKVPSINLSLQSLGNTKVDALRDTLNNKLDTTLDTHGLSIYGHSKINVNGVDRTVGEVLDIGGNKYRVLPDGTLTDKI